MGKYGGCIDLWIIVLYTTILGDISFFEKNARMPKRPYFCYPFHLHSHIVAATALLYSPCCIPKTSTYWGKPISVTLEPGFIS
jgi:hypothetical protein